MLVFITKIVWFLWSTFAPEQAKADMNAIAKDFAKVLLLLLSLSFIIGACFFAGLYFLAQWLLLSIDHTVICYFIATIVSLFFTALIIMTSFRFIIVGFLRRANEKGNDVLNAFTFKK